MDKVTPQLDRIIKAYREELIRSGVRVTALFLFGSYARGEEDDDSDIDLVVVSPDFAPLDLLERLQTLGRAAGRIMEPVEAYGVTPEEIEEKRLSPFWEYIMESEAVPI